MAYKTDQPNENSIPFHSNVTKDLFNFTISHKPMLTA